MALEPTLFPCFCATAAWLLAQNFIVHAVHTQTVIKYLLAIWWTLAGTLLLATNKHSTVDNILLWWNVRNVTSGNLCSYHGVFH